MDLDSVRQEMPVCSTTIYLNTGWSGPSPISVVEAVKERIEYENRLGPTSPPAYQSGKEIQQIAKDSVASLLNVLPEEITLTQCTTDGLNTVLNGIDWNPGDEVITFGLEHSSVLIPAYHLQDRHGVTLRILDLQPGDSRESILNKVESVITSRTRMLFFSHIQYTCGFRMPVKELRSLTKSKDILMLVDGAQTAGHIVLDLRELDCDFYSIPGQKWLLGPDGTGALYIRRDLIQSVSPKRVSGRAVVSYDNRGNYESDLTSMDKFLLTTMSVPLAAGLAEAIRFHKALDPNVVEKHTLDLSRRLKYDLMELPGINLLSPTDDDLSCGLTSFQVKGKEPIDVVNRLWDEHGIVVRQVNELSCVRASTHIFNTVGEIEALVDAVKNFAK